MKITLQSKNILRPIIFYILFSKNIRVSKNISIRRNVDKTKPDAYILDYREHFKREGDQVNHCNYTRKNHISYYIDLFQLICYRNIVVNIGM